MNPNEPYLDLPEEDELSSEQLDLKVQKAQEQLLSLKRQQDFIEKQKRELEELSRRQEEFQAGRSEMLDKLARAVAVLEREILEAQRRVELLNAILETFSGHLQLLEEVNPKAWEPGDFNRELSKALSALDDAKSEYNRCLPRIQPDAMSEPYEQEAHPYQGLEVEHDFGYWARSGFAFTLPLFILGILFLLISLLR